MKGERREVHELTACSGDEEHEGEHERVVVMITMDFGISPGCYQVEGVKTLNYSGNSVVK